VRWPKFFKNCRATEKKKKKKKKTICTLRVVTSVAMAMMLRDFGPYKIIFVTMCTVITFAMVKLLRRILGPMRDEVTGGWRKLREELHNFYSSPNFIRMMKSRKTRWAVHVARMGEMRTTFWLGSLKGRCHLEDLVADGRIIFKCMLGK
jgi:uncharacterized membrane protein